MVKIFPAFMECESSLPSSQKPAIGPYPKQGESSPHAQTLYVWGPFQYYSPIRAYVWKVVFSLAVFQQKFLCSSHFLHACYMSFVSFNCSGIIRCLTPRSRDQLQRLIIDAQLVRKFPAFRGTQRCITVFKRDCMSCMIYPTFSHAAFSRSILLSVGAISWTW